MSTTTGTIQTIRVGLKHCKRTEYDDLTLPIDRNRPIRTDLRHLSLTVSRQNWLINSCEPDLEHSTDHNHSLDSDDDVYWEFLIVSHHYRQQSFSGLHSPRRSDYTFTYYPQVKTIYWSSWLGNTFSLSGP